MITKYIVLAVALIIATPVFAAGGGSSSGGSSSGGNSSGGGHSGGGGGSGGGGHGSGGGGGGGHFGGGLGGRGAAASAHGATLAGHGAQHAGAIHAGRAVEGKHMAMESASKMTGMHHHHHPGRNQPEFEPFLQARFGISCVDHLTPDRPWSDCFGTAKTPAHGANSHS